MSYKIPEQVAIGTAHPDYHRLLTPAYNHIDFSWMAYQIADQKHVIKFTLMAPRELALAYLLGSGVQFPASNVPGTGFVGADHYDHDYIGL